MDLLRIPATLPPAITVSREVAAFCRAEDLETYGTSGPAALAWRWALTGQGPTPVSLRGWHEGPPDRETVLDESRWPRAPVLRAGGGARDRCYASSRSTAANIWPTQSGFDLVAKDLQNE